MLITVEISPLHSLTCKEVLSVNVPFAPRAIDGVWVALFAVMISFLATLYPSWSAMRILPAEALRYE
jgi:lipoprotein-releasing system permease protein